MEDRVLRLPSGSAARELYDDVIKYKELLQALHRGVVMENVKGRPFISERRLKL